MSRYPFLILALLLASIIRVDAGGPVLPIDSLRGTTPPADTSRVMTPPPSIPRPGDTVWQDIKDVGIDFVDLFSRPAHWRGLDWGLCGGSVALIGSMGGLDATLRTSAIGERSPTRTTLAELGNTMGRVAPGAIIAATLYTGGLALDLPGVRRAGRHVFQSALYAGLVTMSVKGLVGRHRPFLGDGPYVFSGVSASDEYNSFPSGHATMAFSVASSLSADIDHPAATVVLYGLATITAWSRMYDDRHWGSDVVAGSILGTVVGYSVATMDDPNDAVPGTGSIRVVPTLNGLAIVGTW